jgi:hypothetical protein
MIGEQGSRTRTEGPSHKAPRPNTAQTRAGEPAQNIDPTIPPAGEPVPRIAHQLPPVRHTGPQPPPRRHRRCNPPQRPLWRHQQYITNPPPHRPLSRASPSASGKFRFYNTTLPCHEKIAGECVGIYTALQCGNKKHDPVQHQNANAQSSAIAIEAKQRFMAMPRQNKEVW